jgi:hypothetical protein
MESQTLVLGIIIAALCLLFVLWPFINLGSRDRTRAESSTLESLYEQRKVLYTTIRDLDFDYDTGKLTEDDYLAQREVWVQRGVEILKALDHVQQQMGDSAPAVDLRSPVQASSNGNGDLDAQIEAAVASRRRG